MTSPNRSLQSLLRLPLILGLISQTSTITLAQISSDGSLPTTVNTVDGLNFRIENGALDQGNNLFHSFAEFSVPTGGSAFFNNAANIVNIFSRVTGGSLSEINGLIQANGNANLFLLNPNGIIFGPNATLNIGGSFVGSTADSIQFNQGNQFSATTLETPPLIEVNIPIGLQLGATPEEIRVQGPGNNLFVDPFVPGNPIVKAFRPTGLGVNPGQTLALIGGNIVLEGGNLTTFDGSIELGSVGGNESVLMSVANPGVVFNYDEVSQFQDIQLSQTASVDVSGNGDGIIQVQGRHVALTKGSAMLAETFGNGSGGLLNIQASESVTVEGTSTFSPAPQVMLPFSSRLSTNVAPGGIGNGGQVTIDTGVLQVTNGGKISSGTFGAGDGGGLSINADVVSVARSLSFPLASPLPPLTVDFISGLSTDVAPNATGAGGTLNVNTEILEVITGGQLSSGTLGAGDGGTLTINAQDILVEGGASTGPSGLFTPVAPGATGNGGELTIDTGRLQVLEGAQIAASTFGLGEAGNINIQAQEAIFRGTSPGGNPSGVFVNVEPGATGNGGEITIESDRIHISDGAQAAVLTFSSGDGGTLSVKAKEIELLGGSPQSGPSAFLANVEPDATGVGGRIFIETESLSIAGGAQAAVTTFSSSQAGDLTVQASQITLAGTSPNGIPSGLFSNVQESASGTGGNLSISTDQLQIIDGAQVAAVTLGSGNTGSLDIQATEIAITGGGISSPSGLFTTVSSGATGSGQDLSVSAEHIQLSDGGQISVSTAGAGDGGTLQVQATELELIGGAEQGASGLFGNAIVGTGTGGDLQLTAEQVTIRDGATISTSNFSSTNPDVPPGQGRAGNIEIQANSILLESQVSDRSSTITASTASGGGGNIILQGLDSLIARDGSQITSEARSTGDGGTISITTNLAELTSGSAISTSILGEGAGGSLIINAGTLSFKGEGSGAFSEAGKGSLGDGGSMTVTVDDSLELTDGAQISTNSDGLGQAGDIRVATGQNILIDHGKITATSQQTGGGDINVSTNFLLLNNQSLISTSVLDSTGGGGNVAIRSDQAVILQNASHIQANAVFGPGGNIQIMTEALLVCTDCQISASSEFGVDGVVEVNSSELGKNLIVEELPENVVNPTSLIAKGCTAHEGNVLAVTGRGGLPENPYQPSRGEVLWSDLRPIERPGRAAEASTALKPTVSQTQPETVPSPVVIAQGWIVGANGKIVFTAAENPEDSPGSWQHHAQCGRRGNE